MITEAILEKIGFRYVKDIWSSHYTWAILKDNTKDPSMENDIIVSYDLNKECCRSIMGEFTIISRKCTTEYEVRKFIECIQFLYF